MKQKILKKLAWEGPPGIQKPPFSEKAARDAGYMLWMLQVGRRVAPPDSQPMTTIGSECHELRIDDPEVKLIHRIFYAIRSQAIVVLFVLAGKKTEETPQSVIKLCKTRLAKYEIRDGK